MIRLSRTAASRCRVRGMNNENTQATSSDVKGSEAFLTTIGEPLRCSAEFWHTTRNLVKLRESCSKRLILETQPIHEKTHSVIHPHCVDEFQNLHLIEESAQLIPNLIA